MASDTKPLLDVSRFRSVVNIGIRQRRPVGQKCPAIPSADLHECELPVSNMGHEFRNVSARQTCQNGLNNGQRHHDGDA